MNTVTIKSEIFTFFRDKKFGTSDWNTDKNNIILACLHHRPEQLERLLPTTEWTPFELMITVISSNRHNENVAIWNRILSLLTPEDTVKTIIDPDSLHQYTLLSLLCYNATLHKPKKNETNTIYQKIESLLSLGCKWDSQENHSPLLWFIWSNECLELLKWCIEKGANPHHGHLLCYSSNYKNKQMQLEKTKAEEFSKENPELPDPIILQLYKPLKNNLILDYLISIGLDVDDTLENGRTPLLSACSEGTIDKVQALVEAGASIYCKTNDDTDVWFWAEQHYTMSLSNKHYPIQKLLLEYEKKQKFWKNVLEEIINESTMLQKVSYPNLIQVLVV